MGRILVLGETHAGDLDPGFWEQVSAAVHLGEQTGWAFEVLVVGSSTEDAVTAATRSGADRVRSVDHPRLESPWPEAVAEVMAAACDRRTYAALVMPRSLLGAEVAARLAARLGAGMAMDVMTLRLDGEGLVVTRPVFGGAATATIRLTASPWILVPRTGSFPSTGPTTDPTVEPSPFATRLDDASFGTTIVSQEYQETEGQDLARARVVVAGGRGMGGPEPFRLLREIATRLDGTVAASRPPCDAGWVEPRLQVGLTGTTVAADLYVAVGISGASQHMTGCSSSRVIVAVNNDPNAPIFRMASHGVVGDWQDVLPALLDGLSAGLPSGPAGTGRRT